MDKKCGSRDGQSVALEDVPDVQGQMIEQLPQYIPRRDFSILSLLGMGFALTNSWWAIASSLGTGLPQGGTSGIVYGIILVFMFSSCVGITLSELASAWPHPGGQYYWTAQLTSPRYRRFAAYCTGYISLFGALFTTSSVALAEGSSIVGLLKYRHPSIDIKPWMVFVVSEVLNFGVALFNIHGRILPPIGKICLWVTLISFLVTLLTVLACSSGNYNSPSFVFAKLTNESGWNLDGIAFLVGLINPSWAFSCLDAATHLAEEVVNPERAIPIAIMGTVLIGFVTAFSYIIGVFFCAVDLDSVASPVTGVPILEVFSQTVVHPTGVILLEILVILSGIGTLISSQTWQSRIAWSFSRDGGILGSRYWSRFHPHLHTPIYSHMLCSTICAILLCLYMASITAFNSVVSACVVFLNLSYLVPTVAILVCGRNKVPHGPFFLGFWGAIANCCTIIWICFTTIFFCFPFFMPATAGNMNYLSAVLGTFFVYVIAYWFVRGKGEFWKEEPHS